MFPPVAIAEYESLDCPQYEKMNLKNPTVAFRKDSNMQKMLEKQITAREQLSLNIKTIVGHSGNNTDN